MCVCKGEGAPHTEGCQSRPPQNPHTGRRATLSCREPAGTGTHSQRPGFSFQRTFPLAQARPVQQRWGEGGSDPPGAARRPTLPPQLKPFPRGCEPRGAALKQARGTCSLCLSRVILSFGHYNFQGPAEAPQRCGGAVFRAQQTTKQNHSVCELLTERVAGNADLIENFPGRRILLCKGTSLGAYSGSGRHLGVLSWSTYSS